MPETYTQDCLKQLIVRMKAARVSVKCQGQ